jgi:hypothetical protein
VIALYDLKGKQVRTLFAGTAGPGRHSLSIDKAGKKLAAGLYRCRMEAAGFSKTLPVLLK